MKLWIVVCGKPLEIPPQLGTAEDYARYASALPESGIEGDIGRTMEGAGRLLLRAPGRRAAETARLLFPRDEVRVDARLAAIPRGAPSAGKAALPFPLWRLLADRQARRGDPRQPESRRESIARCESLLDELERSGRDTVLLAEESLLPLLLDRLRLRSYDVQRSGLMGYAPLERLLATAREEHCGGCGHNCLLSNPSCGIGRDKAARLKR
jgi:hypothetical protein